MMSGTEIEHQQQASGPLQRDRDVEISESPIQDSTPGARAYFSIAGSSPRAVSGRVYRRDASGS
jgi:hypothetical protein